MSSALNRLCKWRTVFAGWQLGTRMKGDPECDAVSDHRELTMVLRAELTAVTTLLIQKGVFTEAEHRAAVEAEAELLSKDYERKFPGFKATDHGMLMAVAIAADTMRGWRK